MNDVFEKIDLNSVDWKSSREFFDSLVDELQKLDNKDESYDFTWVGKRKSIIEAGRPIDKILRPDVEASKDFDKTKNMLIVGDNLDALKLLQESYLGKIKMIYIDPPYNTGHDFVYHDNFTIKKSDFEDGSTDSEGNVVVSEDEFAENSKVNGRFHSDWLSMMYPRLKLARNLLSDDGIIFMSIDDNELNNLYKLGELVFGEDNFGGTAPRKTRGSATTKGDSEMQKINDYLVIFFKDKGCGKFTQRIIGQKKYPHSDERGKYYIVPLQDNGPHGTREARPNLWYPIYLLKDGNVTYDEPSEYIEKILPAKHQNKEGCWMWSKKKFDVDKKDILIKDGKAWIKHYYIEEEDQNQYQRDKLWLEDYQNSKGTILVNSLFPEAKNIFSNPKPIELVKFCANRSANDGSIILDFFSGSGTTGHAVMDLNAEDGGKRQYICVQLDEKTDEKSEARKAGYDTIDQITAERLRRAGEKIKSEHPEADIDTGFRVFRVDGNNENENIRKSPNKTNQSDMFNAIDNIKEDRTPLDLLFGIVYVSALPFDLKLEMRKIGENTVYLYGYLDEGTGLVACFDDNISEETFKEIAKLKALTAAFKDSSFTNSAAKINLSEHFRIISPDTKVKVI